MVILICCKVGETMALIQQFGRQKELSTPQNPTISNQNVSDAISNLNSGVNNMTDLTRQDNQVYTSLQSPSREDNPISAFVKPPDFISLKPLTQDEETAILMQVETKFTIYLINAILKIRCKS